jgi:hypothetical protein
LNQRLYENLKYTLKLIAGAQQSNRSKCLVLPFPVKAVETDWTYIYVFIKSLVIDNPLWGFTVFGIAWGIPPEQWDGPVGVDAALWTYSQIPEAQVPIPPTALLLGSRLLGLVGWRRFRKG